MNTDTVSVFPEGELVRMVTRVDVLGALARES